MTVGADDPQRGAIASCGRAHEDDPVSPRRPRPAGLVGGSMSQPPPWGPIGGGEIRPVADRPAALVWPVQAADERELAAVTRAGRSGRSRDREGQLSDGVARDVDRVDTGMTALGG